MTASESIFSPREWWQTITLEEPFHVEAGKTYEVSFDSDEVPHVREVNKSGRGMRFDRDGTVTAIHLDESGPPTHNVGDE